MPRGGKRPGTGARKGNLNALKHGRDSQQVEEFMLALLSMPRLREILAPYGQGDTGVTIVDLERR